MDEGWILGILFFIVIAVFLILGVLVFQDRTGPHITVVSSFMMGSGLRYAMARKKGTTESAAKLMQYGVILIVCAIVAFLAYYAVSDEFRSTINDFFHGFLDIIGFV